MHNTNNQSHERDTELAREIAKIRQNHPYHGNYREQMAALLAVMFFKFGERVGANRLAALLAENGRSPSTSTAQDEINKFWERMRQQAAVRITRADVPPFLLELFSDMAGKTWQHSMEQAEALFTTHRQEVRAEVMVALSTAEQLREQLAVSRAGAEQALRSLEMAKETREALTRQLAGETARRQAAEADKLALGERLTAAEQARQVEATQLQQALHELRASLTQAAAEQRRLMAIGDDFKQQAARDRAQRLRAEEVQAQQALELGALQQQFTVLSGENGMLAGRLLVKDEQLEQVRRERAADAGNGAARRKVRPGTRTRVR
jgi:hypothetical protein